MAIPPRKIRQLPPALPAKDTDVFPISQMGDDNVPVTRAMTRVQNNAELIAVIQAARQEFVDTANAEHIALHARDDELQILIDANKSDDEDMQTVITLLQEQIANGSGGKNAYQLWIELPGNSGRPLEDFLDAQRGATGSTGATGPQGVMGLKGDRGDIGPIGADGVQGPTGLKGDTGDQGATGIAGPVGPQGAAGSTGPVGPKGDTGASGATLLGTITVSETATSAITAGARRVTISTPVVWGVAVGQNLIAFPLSVPSGLYAVHDVIPTAANTISVAVSAPLLMVGASYSIQCRLVRINT